MAWFLLLSLVRRVVALLYTIIGGTKQLAHLFSFPRELKCTRGAVVPRHRQVLGWVIAWRPVAEPSAHP